MRDGNKSRCVKYETRLVLYAPLVMAIAVLIALMRKSTEEAVSMDPAHQHDREILMKLTAASIANNAIQYGDKVRNNLVNMIETCKNGNDIRTRVGVLLLQDASQKYHQGLHHFLEVEVQSNDF